MSMPDTRLPTSHEAIHELKLRENAEALKALASAAKSSDQFLRRTAVEVIGRHPRGREPQAIILDALTDTSGYVVRTACDVIGQWKLVDAHDRVRALLADASEATRQTAIRTLGSIWFDEDFPLVFHIYSKDCEIDVRREAAWVLRQRATLRTGSRFLTLFAWMSLPDIGCGPASFLRPFRLRKAYQCCPSLLRTLTAT
jgi:HEAT repeat protein